MDEHVTGIIALVNKVKTDAVRNDRMNIIRTGRKLRDGGYISSEGFDTLMLVLGETKVK